jgi:hypothetical protein
VDANLPKTLCANIALQVIGSVDVVTNTIGLVEVVAYQYNI